MGFNFKWCCFGTIVVSVNVVFMALGFLLVYTGTESSTGTCNTSIEDTQFFTKTLATVVLVLGYSLIGTALVGCCSLNTKTRVFAMAYFALVLLLLLVEAGIGVYAYSEQAVLDQLEQWGVKPDQTAAEAGLDAAKDIVHDARLWFHNGNCSSKSTQVLEIQNPFDGETVEWRPAVECEACRALQTVFDKSECTKEAFFFAPNGTVLEERRKTLEKCVGNLLGIQAYFDSNYDEQHPPTPEEFEFAGTMCACAANIASAARGHTLEVIAAVSAVVLLQLLVFCGALYLACARRGKKFSEEVLWNDKKIPLARAEIQMKSY